MVFKNIKILEEDRKEYKVNEIKVNPRFCTISEGKESMLFYCGSCYEDFSKKYFAFVWKDNIIEVTLCQKIDSKSVITWDLLSIDIPQNIEKDRESIILNLRCAIKTYGYDGDVVNLCNKNNLFVNTNRKIVVNF